MRKKNEYIHTDRLTLKSMTAGDAEVLADLFMDPRVNRTFMVPDYKTREEFIQLAGVFAEMSSPEDTEHFVYGVYLDGGLIGFVNDCGIKDGSIEIGYVISPDHQGKGYATEVFSAVIAELRRMGFTRVTAGYFEENPASRRVMEKCGLIPIDHTETGTYRGQQHRCLYCALDL